MLNLVGHALPLVAALFAIPVLVETMGTERFGVLTLAWLVIGYFGLFDLGLGRALTQGVAERISETGDMRAPPVAWAALGLMFALGLVGSALLGATSPWLVRSVLTVPRDLQTETVTAFYVLAAALPAVVTTSGLVGILSAFQRFGTINAIRAPTVLLTYLAPLAIVPFSPSLVPVTWVLVLGRLAAFAANFIACRSILPPLRTARNAGSDISSLLRFGAWMTVSNLLSPLLVYVDRLVIGATLSMAAVAYYATPYEVVTRLLVIPGALIAVLFPAFAATHKHDRERLGRLFTQGTKAVGLILFPMVLVVIAFASDGLRLWLGEEFEVASTPVLQILAIGVFVNGLAQVFFALVQGVGRADLTAKLHAIELVIYLPSLWWAIQAFGIVGAAVASTARVTLDAVLLLCVLGARTELDAGRVRSTLLPLVLALGSLVAALLPTSLSSRSLVTALILSGFATVAWTRMLTTAEKGILRARGPLRRR